MCGIYGYIGLAPESSEKFVDLSSRLLQHRGPDGQGFESGNGWGLGFRRLSILDLSELGNQPMSTPDGRYWIVFNGEIYNYVELKADLEKQGEVFRGTSDTEVLLRLLALEGSNALERLNGMFALAFVDTMHRTFLLARDRLGQKPFYYQIKGGQLRFASELKGLLAWPDATREVNSLAVAQYLAMDYLPNSICIFDGYFKLPHAHYISGNIDEPEHFELETYWQFDITDEEGSSELSLNQIQELHELLIDATRIRLRSDVPIGFFLSGGIDSGLVAAIASSLPGGSDIRALTVSFDEKDFDETNLAKATAEHVGMRQLFFRQKVNGLSDVDRISWFFDEPFGDPSAIPTFNLCKTAAEYGTVFLTGDGGDEAFGGYRKYFRTFKYRLTHSFPAPVGTVVETISKIFSPFSSIRYRLARKSLPDGGFPAAMNRNPIDPVFQLVLSKKMKSLSRKVGQPFWDRWKQYSDASILTRWQKLDYDLYLPDDILVKVDRASMAHSIELRSPFLDYRVVEWAARLPRNTLINTKEGKIPLRKLAVTLLPAEVRAGGKRGFGTPLGSWFQQPEGRSFARERLLSDHARRRGLWDHEGVEKLISRYQAESSREIGPWLWRLLVLDAWARLYVDSSDYLNGPPTVV